MGSVWAVLWRRQSQRLAVVQAKRASASKGAAEHHEARDPWMDGNSGMCSQHVNQFGTNTMSRSPSAEARYATRKSPFSA